MVLSLVVLAALCVLGLTLKLPRIACVLWILALETSPDSWLDNFIGEHETIIGVMKALNRHVERVFSPSRKVVRRSNRKLARDR